MIGVDVVDVLFYGVCEFDYGCCEGYVCCDGVWGGGIDFVFDGVRGFVYEFVVRVVVCVVEFEVWMGKVVLYGGDVFYVFFCVVYGGFVFDVRCFIFVRVGGDVGDDVFERFRGRYRRFYELDVFVFLCCW